MKPEERLHRRVVAELRLTFRNRGFEKGREPFFHCPNESMVPPQYRRKLNAMGLSRGVSDIIIVHPLSHAGGVWWPGMALELKAGSRYRATAEQHEWLVRFEKLGFYTAIGAGPERTADILADVGLLDEEQHARVCAA